MTDNIAKGLRLYVYRNAHLPDCTMGGITSTHTTLTLVGIVDYRNTANGQPRRRLLPDGSHVFAPSGEAPPVWLVMGKHGVQDRHLIPGRTDATEPDGRWWVDGGNYASGDSRFVDLTGNYATRVHDRYGG